MFTTDAFGSPSIIFDSGDGLPDRHTVPLGVHAHGNWGFSAPGTYTLRFTHRATVGGAVQEDTRTTTVVVDDVTPGGGNPGGGAGSGPAPAPGGGSGGGAGNAPGAGPAPGGGGGTPGAGGAAPASSSVAVRSRTARMTSGRRVALRVRCVAAKGTCRGTVTLTSASRITVAGKRRTVRIGRASVAVPAGKTRTVRVRVARRLAGELRGRRSPSLKVRAAVRATVDGRPRTRTSRVALRVR